jgi:SOS-response transcriptional repressor LexA
MKKGEILILKSLMDSPKTFNEIQDKTKLSHQAISIYLKTLQKDGYIERDIDTRKYSLKPLSFFSLLINEIKDFLLENQKFFTPYSFFLFITENEKINKLFEKEVIENIKFGEALNYIYTILDSIIEKFLLNQLSKKEKEIIKKYELYLKKIFKEKVKEEINEEDKEFIFKSFPEKKAKKFLKDLVKASTDLKLWFFINKFELEKGLKEIEKALNEDQKKKLKTHLDFLKNPKNIKIYEKYLEMKIPKSILLCDFGFGEYHKKFNELFSLIKKEEAKPIIG